MSEMSELPKVPKNLVVPLEICSLIMNPITNDTELNFLDLPNQVPKYIFLNLLKIPKKVYGKALHGRTNVSFKNGNTFEGEFENGMLHGFLYYIFLFKSIFNAIYYYLLLFIMFI